MHKLQSNRYAMFHRVQLFCSEHLDELSTQPLIHQILTRLKEALREIAGSQHDQTSKASESRNRTRQKNKVRQLLRVRLHSMAQTAKIIARSVPEFDKRFPPPSGRGDAALLKTAHLFYKRAVPHAERFLQYSASIDEFKIQIELFEQAIRQRSEMRAGQKHATAAIDPAIQKAMHAVTELDVIIHNTLGDHASFLTLWGHACRVRPLSRKNKIQAKSRSASANS